MNAPYLPRPSFLVIGSPTGNSKFRQKTFQSILSLPSFNFSLSASSNKRPTLKVQINRDKCGWEENHSMVQSPTISRPLFHTQATRWRKGRWTFQKVKIFHQLWPLSIRDPCWRLVWYKCRVYIVERHHRWAANSWLKKPKTLKRNIYLRSFNAEACRTNVQLTEQRGNWTSSYLWFWHCKTSIICKTSWNQNFTLRSLFRLEPPPSQQSRQLSWPDWEHSNHQRSPRDGS